MNIEQGIARESQRSLDEMSRAARKLPQEFMNQLRHTARLMREDVQAQMEGQLLGKQSGILQAHVKGKAFRGKGRNRGSVYIAVGQTSKGRSGASAKRSMPQWGVPAYGAFLEHGGVIRPKGGGWLALPLKGGPAQTRTGRRRYASPRDYPGKLRFIPNKNDPNTAVLVEAPKRAKRGRRLQGKVVFVLKKQIYIQPKHWMERGVESRMPPLQDKLARIIDNVLNSGR